MTTRVEQHAQTTHGDELRQGERFAFGANWARFLSVLNDDRIREAEQSLRTMLGVDSLAGRSFLDVGSGSGLFSLAARRLGAAVTSFDFDPQSVACTSELKRRYFPGDASWTVREGSVLDDAFLNTLGRFDVVYSWGVLHHTGQMWRALANVDRLVNDSGRLFIALYNDQGGASKRWLSIKKTYNRLPRVLRPALALGVTAALETRYALIHLVRLSPRAYISDIVHYQSSRGMSWWHDKVDWIGGLPFEVSRPEAVFDFYRDRGYRLDRLTTCGGGYGCNQFVFSRVSTHLPPAR
ncbi:MAG: class I SAM-dependent methyltransferase [Vicinamibacterales bacterium]